MVGDYRLATLESFIATSGVNLFPCYAVALNANRLVTGVLRGFDQFMNIFLDNTVDEKSHTDIGMVVRSYRTSLQCDRWQCSRPYRMVSACRSSEGTA